jgi:hypothetical protein
MPRIVAIEVCLLFNFAVVFNFNVFPFPPSKAQSLGDVPMNIGTTQRIVRLRCEFVFCVMVGDRDSKEDGDEDGDRDGEGDGDEKGDVEILFLL